MLNQRGEAEREFLSYFEGPAVAQKTKPVALLCISSQSLCICILWKVSNFDEIESLWDRWSNISTVYVLSTNTNKNLYPTQSVTPLTVCIHLLNHPIFNRIIILKVQNQTFILNKDLYCSICMYCTSIKWYHVCGETH